MKIKLKKDTLDLGGLASSSSHQGFLISQWDKLNNGETIEVDNIPEICKDNIEEVIAKSPKKEGGK